MGLALCRCRWEINYLRVLRCWRFIRWIPQEFERNKWWGYRIFFCRRWLVIVWGKILLFRRLWHRNRSFFGGIVWRNCRWIRVLGVFALCRLVVLWRIFRILGLCIFVFGFLRRFRWGLGVVFGGLGLWLGCSALYKNMNKKYK